MLKSAKLYKNLLECFMYMKEFGGKKSSNQRIRDILCRGTKISFTCSKKVDMNTAKKFT